MTETASGATSRGGGKAHKGLTIQRIHTREGVHPYDEVTWERRDVVMTNWRDGTVNFEQHGVEFPDFWSVNAANIVTTKYFRGAVGTAQREWSLKQLVDRVVGKYTEAGRQHGYFATPKDAEIFDHELKHALIHQIFSFNSPVWFNVGTKVYDAAGLTKIVATKANGVKDVLRLHTSAGYTLDVTADHLVWRATDTTSGRFVPAGALRAGDQLQWHRRPSFGEAEIDTREVAEAALAGWFQSDGFVGQY